MIGGVTIWEIIWKGGLPHLSGLPHLPGVPHLHHSFDQKSPSFLGHVVLKRGAPTGSLQIKPSGSGDENDSGQDRDALLTCWHV